MASVQEIFFSRLLVLTWKNLLDLLQNILVPQISFFFHAQPTFFQCLKLRHKNSVIKTFIEGIYESTSVNIGNCHNESWLSTFAPSYRSTEESLRLSYLLSFTIIRRMGGQAAHRKNTSAVSKASITKTERTILLADSFGGKKQNHRMVATNVLWK